MFLDRAANAGWSDGSFLERDVRFDPIRNDQRLSEIVEKMANTDLVPA